MERKTYFWTTKYMQYRHGCAVRRPAGTKNNNKNTTAAAADDDNDNDNTQRAQAVPRLQCQGYF